MIDIENITKSYNGSYKAVNNLNLKINDGEIFGLLGPNGAGKSTTVSMISTVKSPTSGEIKVDNISLNKNPIDAKKVMGIVPQDIA